MKTYHIQGPELSEETTLFIGSCNFPATCSCIIQERCPDNKNWSRSKHNSLDRLAGCLSVLEDMATLKNTCYAWLTFHGLFLVSSPPLQKKQHCINELLFMQ